MKIKNVTTWKGEKIDLTLQGAEHDLDGNGLTLLPALIDPHVHFRVPGAEHKEDWKSAAIACVRGGITTVCDMPNNTPTCTTAENFNEKCKRIDAQLKAVGIPLRYKLYLGADRDHLDEIEKVSQAPAIKVFMGSSTGTLLIDDEPTLEKVFQKAKGKLIAVHAEDEALLRAARYASTDPAAHSKMRTKEAAVVAVERAIALATKYNNPLYVLHISTKEEVELIRAAKKRGVPVFAETTPHHLFLSTDDYAAFGTLVQVNPPLRDKVEWEALWEGIADGTIDTIGTDHAPHTLQEKAEPYGKSPSGLPGVETLLPLLLDAVYHKKLTLAKLVELTRTNSEKLFSLSPNDDCVLVDLNLEKEVKEEELSSKCGWSPYRGRCLRGWPVYTILKGHLFYGSGFSRGKTEGRPQLKNGVPGGTVAE